MNGYLNIPKNKKVQIVNIFDFINYNMHDAKNLENELGWRPYGDKHCESIYTCFHQGYILPKKFNIDKRKAHLSTLIMSGQISRKEALKKIQNDPYEENLLQTEMEFVLKKFNFTKEEFEQIICLYR